MHRVSLYISFMISKAIKSYDKSSNAVNGAPLGVPNRAAAAQLAVSPRHPSTEPICPLNESSKLPVSPFGCIETKLATTMRAGGGFLIWYSSQ